MDDPHSDKAPRGPILSTEAVAYVCLTVAFCAFMAFASHQPDAAFRMGGAIIAVAVAAFFLLGHR